MGRSLSKIVQLLLIALCCGSLSCGSRDSDPASESVHLSKTTPTPVATPTARSKPGIADAISDEPTDEITEEDEDDKSDAGEDSESEPGYFHGYRCTDDCSGHEAGYKWAELHNIDDPERCGGRSQSFIEGCRSWADENH